MIFFVACMSRLFLATFVMVSFVHNARADEKASDLCESLSSMAKSIMSARQAGVEMGKMIKEFENGVGGEFSKEAVEGIGKLAKEYTVRAYGFPRLYDITVRKEAVLEFGNRIYSECYKAHNK